MAANNKKCIGCGRRTRREGLCAICDKQLAQDAAYQVFTRNEQPAGIVAENDQVAAAPPADVVERAAQVLDVDPSQLASVASDIASGRINTAGDVEAAVAQLQGDEQPDAPAAPAAMVEPPLPDNFMEKAIVLVVRRGRFGNSRKANTDKITVDADKKMLALTKRLLESKELDEIRKFDGETRGWLTSLCLPSMFKDGAYMLPIPLVERVDGELKQRAARRAELVDAFIAVYPDKVREVATALRDLYNPADYPSVDTVRAMFIYEWQYVTFGVPGQLKAISAQLFEQEREKAAAQLRVAADECRQVMRAGMLDLVDHMVDRLGQPAEGGKRKVFRDSLVRNMQEFLNTFELRDITDDTALAQVVKRARDLMAGVDPVQLRKDEGLRDAVAAGFAQVKDQLDGMVVERTRKLQFEDE